MPKATPSTSVMFQPLGPTSDMMDMSSSSGGNAIQASTPRCTSMSTRPPK